MFWKKAGRKKRHDYIRRRGQEVTRIEAFSDAVFAFAVTLLIVSLEVPHNYNELMDNLKFFVPFGISFAIMFTIWHQQNIFFRRYGMHDVKTVALNGALLFFVLVYMFPLKFLFGMLFSNKFHVESVEQFSILFCLYFGGFATFSLLFALMYLNAYSQRGKIKLTDMEAFQTKTVAYVNFLVVAVSVVALIIALTGGEYSRFAGTTYILIGPGLMILTRRRARLFKQRFGDVDAPPVNEHMHAHAIHEEEEN
jgi:uncharacterized membrane protein